MEYAKACVAPESHIHAYQKTGDFAENRSTTRTWCAKNRREFIRSSKLSVNMYRVQHDIYRDSMVVAIERRFHSLRGWFDKAYEVRHRTF